MRKPYLEQLIHSPDVTGMSLLIFVAAETGASQPLPSNWTTTSIRCYSFCQAVFTKPLPRKWSYSSQYVLVLVFQGERFKSCRTNLQHSRKS
jgi:hypothetical protein